MCENDSTIKFDVTNDEAKIPYAYIKGNETVVIIKAGKGGDYLGYENKYLQIAHNLNEKHGYTVVCISNPMEAPLDFSDVDIISKISEEMNIRTPKFHLMGTSDGAIKGLELLSKSVQIKSLLLVNMPLMINYVKNLKHITSHPDAKVTFVFGNKDPSFNYLPFLASRKIPNVNIVTVEGADHNFTGMLRDYIKIATDFFDNID